ncbi:MAG: alpha-E domain-containing protein [Acidobacteriota bacterium]|jgi:uncharacterized alpha-E superfamily protein|nr:alpha-E domain-containing protein [Acidobacteriota bacterium]
MGSVLSKTNRLFWLGRYNERVYTSLKFVVALYDRSIDGPPTDYAEVCRRLDIPCPYSCAEEFFRSFIFDVSNPDSIAQSADRMLGNGMVLREVISSTTLSYLQMAVNALRLAAKSGSPALELQWVLDDIMAFRGSFEDFIVDETVRNIIKCGISVERVSMFERLGVQREEAGVELRKLVYRMAKTRLPVDPGHRDVILQKVVGGVEPEGNALLVAVESLFTV